MKQIFILFFTLLSLSAIAQSQIVLEKNVHDFGKIKEVDGVVTTVFKFKNTSDKPYIIKYISVSCGCTTPKYSKAPVLSGASSEISVSYDPAGRPGAFSKTVYVASGSSDTVNELTIKGDVEPRPRSVEDDYPVVYFDGLRASSTAIAYREIPLGYRHTKAIEIYNSSTKPLDLKITPKGSDSRLSANLSTTKLAPKEKGQILVTYDLKTTPDYYGSFLGEIDFEINGKSTQAPLFVRGVSVPDFTSYSPEMLRNSPRGELSSRFTHLGNVSLSKKMVKEFTIYNNGVDPLKIVSQSKSSESVKYTLSQTTAENGETIKVTIELTPPKGVKGRVSESVTLITNDPVYPVKEIRIAANIE